MKEFRKKITKLFKLTYCPTNLIPQNTSCCPANVKEYPCSMHQQKMGPALMDCTTYIQKALADHLSDAKTYYNRTVKTN
jgi:hypothetical protein